MKKKVDKIIALVIACIMVFSLMPRSMNHVIASTTETASMTDATEAVTVDADDSEIENVSPTEDKEKDTEDDISDDSDVNSDTEDGQEPEEDTEEDTEEETEEDVAFDSSVTCDGVVIRVTADEGVFPAGATLSAKKVSDSQAEAAGVADAVEEKRDNNVNVAASLTFDITVYDKDGNEIEPDTEKGEVKVSFSYPLIANKNLDTNVYHIKDEAGAPEAEKLNADEDGSIAEVTTDGFSYYTVEFTYGEKQYVMNGDTTIPLSSILSYVGLTGDVTAVSVSNASLFSASNGGNGWIVTAHKAFSSIEWMKVTIDGIEYEIVVTDDSPQFSIDTSTRFSPQEKIDTYVAYYRKELGFDVQGAGGIQTTFANRGYKTELKVGDDQHQLSEFYFGDTYIYKGIKVRIKPSLPSGSKGVVITYEIENTNLDKTTIKIGSWADVQIGSNDHAPIELKDNGLVMTGDGNTFTLVPGGGNFNTKWFGYYGNAQGNVFENSDTYQGDTGWGGTSSDSGIAWSWTLEIQPGARITKTAVLAAGDIQTYTLSFNANGGSGTMNPQTYVGGVSTALPPKAFTSNDTNKPDFMGWADSQAKADAGTIDYYDEGDITLNSNKTLYAVWGLKQLQEVHITVPNINMTYGDIGVYVQANSDGGGSLSYEVKSGSDVISVNYTTGAITAKKYGDAEIKVTAAETPTHKKGEATATVHVYLKDIALKANDASKTYGSNDPSFTSIYTVTGSESLVDGDTISNSFTTSGGIGRVAGENVGTYSIKGNGITSEKYNVTSVTPGTLTITPKALTIAAAAKSKAYGENDPALTYTATGLANGDTTSVITGSLTRDPGEVVGTYPITKGDISAGNNYTVSYTGANLTINPKPITITSDGGEKVYDGTPLTKNGYTNTALAFDDAIESVAFTGSQTLAGSSNNTLSNAVIKNGEQNVTANYSITYNYGTLTVTKKALTITANDATKTYDSTPLTSDAYDVTGLIAGDEVESVTFTGSQTNVGSSNNVPSAAVIKNGGTDVTSCYAITYKNGTLKVTRKAVTVTADNKGKVYGDGDPVFTATVSGTLGGDSVVYSFSRAAGEDIGEYTITPAGDTDQGNYTVSYETGKLTISEAVLNITAVAKSKTYGEADPELTYTVSGLKNGDTVAIITGSLTRTEGETVGDYAILQGTIAAGNNYAISYTGANLTINQKPLTITTEGAEKVYDGTALTKESYTNTELAFDDDIESVTFTGSQTVVGSSDNTVGTVVIKNGDQDVTANYNISYVNGTLKVTEKALTITATDATKIYDSTALTSDAYEATELGDGDAIESVTFEGSQTDVGSSKNKPSDAVIMKGSVTVTDCYDITYVEGTLEVTKATITVTEGITAEDKQYDATTDATLDFSGAVLDGKCGNDDVSVTATGTFSDKNVGADKTVTITGLELTGDEAGRIIHAKSFGIKVDGYDESFNSYYDDGCLKYHIEFVEYGDNIDTSESRFYEYEQKGDTIIVKEYSLYSQDALERMADWPEPPEIEPEPVATVSCGGEVGFYKDKNPEHVYTYKMDGTKLLSVAVAHESVLETNPEYSYDQNGRLVKIESMWESYRFDYDEKGNIISIEFEGSSEEGDKIKSAVTYEYKNLRDLYIEYKNGKKTGTVEDSDRKTETDTVTAAEDITDTVTEETTAEIPANKTTSSDKTIYSDDAKTLLSRFYKFLKNPAGYSGNIDEMGYIGMWANKHQEDCTSGYKYMVEDLDDDGIDEVIISYGDSSKTVNLGPMLGETGLLIYTFKNGEAQIVTDFTPHSSTTVYKLENGNVVECIADGNYYFCWKIINIKASMEYSPNEEYVAEGETDNDLSYSYKDSSGNDKSMSKEEYESAISNIQKSIIKWEEGDSFADHKE